MKQFRLILTHPDVFQKGRGDRQKATVLSYLLGAGEFISLALRDLKGVSLAH